MSLALAKKSSKLLINYYKSEKEAKNLEERIKREMSGEVLIYKADISKYREVSGMVNYCMKNFGGIDIIS
ncbi:MAG: SDR family NAD(P)-dependent oxidoreductase [Candidatus Pacearchaeota archaeon]